jgi:riboflavin synthase
MFTGLIEEIGKVIFIKQFGGGLRISFSASIVLKDLQIGDSININGVCLTVVGFTNDTFEVESVEETLKKTNLGRLKLNNIVNLERSLTLNKKLGGHFVLGHVDTTGKITGIKKLASSYVVTVSYPKEFSGYLVNVGSIALDGISLTIAGFDENHFNVSVIPHTLKSTNLAARKKGDEVNLEFDILGKYVARLIGKDKKEKITEEWLRDLGYK